MKIYVNDKTIDILPGMKVRHALLSAGLLEKDIAPESVTDAWGNEIGMDGELTEGERIYIPNICIKIINKQR